MYLLFLGTIHLATHVEALTVCEESQLVYDEVEDQRRAEYNEILSRLRHVIFGLEKICSTIDPLSES